MPLKNNDRISYISSTFVSGMLSLFILTGFLCCSPSKTHKTKDTSVEYTMTVIRILPEGGGDYFKIAFNKSPRIFRMDKNINPDYINLLKQSLRDNTPVVIKREKEESDIIIRVEKLKDK